MSEKNQAEWLRDRAYQTLLENGFEPRFSDAVEKQIDEIEAAGQALENVEDLRDLSWSSIDNHTSRDLDQVEWAERLQNGDIRLLVAIADVDSLVPRDSPIDRHAAANTVSVYTIGRVFPMLPEPISTGLTSLNEGADRLAVVADMTIKENGDVPSSTFFRARVHNRAKLSYPEVARWFDRGTEPEGFSRVPGLRGQIELQREAALRLHAYREAKGALEFESIESAAIIENGEVKGIEAVQQNSARKLIENFMIAANVEMAEFIEARGWPSVRRVVKEPKYWDGIRRIAEEHGETLPAHADQPLLAAFLARRREADPLHFPDLSLSIIKLIGSGEYIVERPGEDAGGHFGLAVRDYAHSTAPNRRYADLVVQRIVKALIAGENSPYTVDELEQIAEHLNTQERAVRKVERKMRKIVAASVMQRRVGERFDAIVTGVTPSGTFARILHPPVDGRIEKNEGGLNVGEKVNVTLISADPGRGFIDFAANR